MYGIHCLRVVPSHASRAAHNGCGVPASHLRFGDAALDVKQWPLPAKPVLPVGGGVTSVTDVSSDEEAFVVVQIPIEPVTSNLHNGIEGT